MSEPDSGDARYAQNMTASAQQVLAATTIDPTSYRKVFDE
jgi:hypothetical protein